MDIFYNNLLKNIIDYFVEPATREAVENYHKVSTLIRIQSDYLVKLGDVSFPAKPEIWLKYFSGTNRKIKDAAFAITSFNEETAKEQRIQFYNASKQWQFPVEKLTVRDERILLYFNRTIIVRSMIPEVLRRQDYGHLQKVDRNVYLIPMDAVGRGISCYRCNLMYSVLKNHLKYSKWKQVDNTDSLDRNSDFQLEVRSVASECKTNNGIVVIKCGSVTGTLNDCKNCQITTDAYLRHRTSHMTLVVMHQYAVRFQQDAQYRTLMDRLGSAAVTVDLLEVKHTSPVKIVESGYGSTKGAAFILYNTARLQKLLRIFQERIDKRVYDPLPSIDAVQMNLLIEEEEWRLVYVYLAGFPNVIARCTNPLELGSFPVHLLIHFIQGLVATFSIYYRRVKILTENRNYLMPVLYARIYLLKAVQQILNKSLALLNIQPVESM